MYPSGYHLEYLERKSMVRINLTPSRRLNHAFGQVRAKFTMENLHAFKGISLIGRNTTNAREDYRDRRKLKKGNIKLEGRNIRGGSTLTEAFQRCNL